MRVSASKSFSLVAAITVASTISGCAQSQWQAKFAAGNTAYTTKPAQLEQAERQYRAAIADAEKYHIPEAQYAAAITALGELLSQEGRFAEAKDYLLRSVSLANATEMSVPQNIKMLKLLENAYEQTKDFEQAAQTQQVLLTFVETQMSPLSQEYMKDSVKNDELKRVIAAQPAAAKDACCEEEAMKKPAEKTE